MAFISWKQYGIVDCKVGSLESFWESIEVWIRKSHVLNKRIGAVDTFNLGPLDSKCLQKCCHYFETKLLKVQVKKAFVEQLVNLFKKEFVVESSDNNFHTCLRLIYSKDGSLNKENIDIVVKDTKTNQVIFIKPIKSISKLLPVSSTYSVTFSERSLILKTPIETTDYSGVQWLLDVLLPKLVSWMKPNLTLRRAISTNQLVPPDKYLSTYNILKKKYFSAIKEIWKESTNPEKFIYEDIAIATYLLIIWGDKPQRFVDLGCGNGLLVHILNSEKHQGVGIDVRSRKIWSSYPETTILKESTVVPSLHCIFPEADWIIGNHSDELTPWIPVITAKSSYKCNFFLLPCCLFDFSGQKYSRTNTKLSSYESYMDYVSYICKSFGFHFDRDRMKIPSTKRTCFVSKGRIYSEKAQHVFLKQIDRFVLGKLTGDNTIKLRETTEKVRNCTKLNKGFVDSVVNRVASYILAQSKNSNNNWREGEFIDIKELIQLISQSERQLLKNECGGVQTLLKNHYNIFLVVNGKVKLRKPTERKVAPEVFKKKECWFYKNHPDSCPLPDDKCTYIHSK